MINMIVCECVCRCCLQFAPQTVKKKVTAKRQRERERERLQGFSHTFFIETRQPQALHKLCHRSGKEEKNCTGKEEVAVVYSTQKARSVEIQWRED